MIEIRIHGRGGQGAVIASKVLAAAFFAEGKDVQAFPAFGVERRGALIVAAGESADLAALPAGVMVPEGPVAVAAGETALPGVFLGGALVARAGSVAAAIGEGARAARRIHAYLHGETVVGEMPDSPVAFGDLNPDTVPRTPRAIPRRLPPAERLLGFFEVSRGLGTSRAHREATRCLHCGACTAYDLCWAFCRGAPDRGAGPLRHRRGPGEARGRGDRRGGGRHQDPGALRVQGGGHPARPRKGPDGDRP